MHLHFKIVSIQFLVPTVLILFKIGHIAHQNALVGSCILHSLKRSLMKALKGTFHSLEVTPSSEAPSEVRVTHTNLHGPVDHLPSPAAFTICNCEKEQL
ncbi:hypothetical protein M758_7G109300 [Ceratodon purpureus]|nr:hypothetical protein M758_7G109300 [Ceratodon purpureus]